MSQSDETAGSEASSRPSVAFFSSAVPPILYPDTKDQIDLLCWHPTPNWNFPSRLPNTICGITFWKSKCCHNIPSNLHSENTENQTIQSKFFEPNVTWSDSRAKWQKICKNNSSISKTDKNSLLISYPMQQWILAARKLCLVSRRLHRLLIEKWSVVLVEKSEPPAQKSYRQVKSH